MDAIEAYARGEGPLAEPTTERERSMLAYAVALTADPSRVSQQAIVTMREAGLDDGSILEANQVVAYFAYVNRVIDGLGVQLEPHLRG
jgi:alkylhydroperoxidase family enzyme